MDLTERAILGLPIETPYGLFKPLTLRDYLERGDALAAITFDKRRVLHEIRLNQDEETQNSTELTKLLREMDSQYSLKQILIEYMEPYFHAYVEIIARCKVLENEETLEGVREEVYLMLHEIDPEEFDALRNMILVLNNQSSQTASLDPTIQKWKEKAIKFKSSDKDAPNIPTMVTSVVSFSGHTFEEISNWNITQLLQVFQRIGMLKAYDTTSLFATVTDKIDIQNWSENIEIEDDSNTSSNVAISFKQFQGNVGDAIQS